MYKCSYPNCKHIGILITDNHCTTSHQMSKADVKQKYGAFEVLRKSPHVLKNRSAFYTQENITRTRDAAQAFMHRYYK